MPPWWPFLSDSTHTTNHSPAFLTGSYRAQQKSGTDHSAGTRGGYHSLAGIFIPTPAVWEPLTFSLTFLQRSWLPPCCSSVTQTLINACDIWRGICDWADISLHCAWPTSPHSWRTGLYLVARSHTASSSDSVHTEKSSCSESVLVQLCEQVQSVRHVCCVLCKSVFGQMPFEQLSSYSTLQTPDGLYKHCRSA